MCKLLMQIFFFYFSLISIKFIVLITIIKKIGIHTDIVRGIFPEIPRAIDMSIKK